MWSIAFIILIAIILMVIDVPSIVRKKEIKELLFFFTFLIAGVTLNILNVLHINIPSPVSLLRIVYGPVSNWIELMLG
jgi:predicted cation transporter